MELWKTALEVLFCFPGFVVAYKKKGRSYIKYNFNRHVRMNKIILVTGAILVLGGALFLWQIGLPGYTGSVPYVEEVEEASIFERILSGNGTQKAVLEPVDESNSRGLGYRFVQDGTMLHAVAARMEDPLEGTVYEGWLVQPEPLRFFSTGVLEKNEQGEWVLEFESQEEYPSYTRVMITREFMVDETPEAHILEGDLF